MTDDPPIVAVNANSGNPHYEPTPETSAPIREGDFVLLDIWAKKNTPGRVLRHHLDGFRRQASLGTHAGGVWVVREARDVGVKTVMKPSARASHRRMGS